MPEYRVHPPFGITREQRIFDPHTIGPRPTRVFCAHAGGCQRRESSSDGLVDGYSAQGCIECGQYYCPEHYHLRPSGRASQYCNSCGEYHATCVTVRYCETCQYNHCSVDDYECDMCGGYHCDAGCPVGEEQHGYFGPYRGVYLTFPNSNPHPLANGKRHIGFEIEVENGKSGFDLPRDFGIARDGSLENGVEILTPPANGERLVDIVNDAMSTLADHEWEALETCGLHTHIDMRDKRYDLRYLARMFTLGFAFEQLLYNLQMADRHENGYSIPLRQEYGFNAGRGNVAKDFEFTYEKIDKKERWARMRMREGRRDKYAGQRYMGFNFHSVFHRGSLEIRIHEGTLDPKRALRWADIIQALAERAERRLSYKTLLAFMEIDSRDESIEKAGEILGLNDEMLVWLGSHYRYANQVSIPYAMDHGINRYRY